MDNQANSGPTGSLQTLVLKLCTLFAKDDEDRHAKLFKTIIHFLTNLKRQNILGNDEQIVATKIRKHIKITQSDEYAKEFDVIFSKLQSTAILHNKSQVLSFLLNLSMESGVEFKSWHDLQELLVANSPERASRSQIQFLPDDPGIGVNKLYQSSIGKQSSVSSSKTHTMSVYTGWTNSEHDELKDPISSLSSSRTTLPTLCDITESQIIQEVLYCFQGIEGRIIRKEPGDLGYIIDAKMEKSLTPIQKSLILRLTGLGFLHNNLKSYCSESDEQNGLVGQALTSVFREELTNYYQLIATLQSQIKTTDLTLRRMVVWVAEPHLHLQWLTYIAESCKEKKGGALISVVHGFLQHGSANVQKIAEKVLPAVCRPLYIMLSNWLLDGKLNDPCGEFFIEAKGIQQEERLWHDKYNVRIDMIPSFISLEQANKILATGKSINFLRQICKDTEELPSRDSVHKLFTNSVAEALFTPEQSIEIHLTLDRVYRETSLRVLDLLKNKYRLLEHLQALRRYVLLGQGDFIRHLLELLAPELSKLTNRLHTRTLSHILDSAIRTTSAQYEDEDTLKRINVCLMDSTMNDTGWDVFTLVYLVNGPVGTVFQPTVTTYKCLFAALWKAKRMEFVLSNMRKQQISCNKLFRNMREMQPISHLVHILANEMIHFLHQTQYYFLFEVLECSWAEMLRQVNNAGCLDDVISAHNIFLSSVRSGVLFETNSNTLRQEIGLIFSQILQLQSVQENLYAQASKEREAQRAYEILSESKATFGLTTQIEEKNTDRKANFQQYLTETEKQITNLSKQFKKQIEKYVTLLSTSADMNLQLLSTRLNFNDYYNI